LKTAKPETLEMTQIQNAMKERQKKEVLTFLQEEIAREKER
jgi:hypothetical protein